MKRGHTVEITLRPATADDAGWLWQLHVATLKEYVAQTWGWDEAVQRLRFDDSYDPPGTQIVEHDGQPIGCLRVQLQPDRLCLDNIRVAPEYQNQGVGTQLIRSLQARARELGLPLELRVLRVNPARRLYERLGFVVTQSDPVRHYMRWVPDSSAAEGEP